MNTNKKYTILLVEDDPLLSKMYVTKFTSEGFTVLKAEDGEEGFKLASENAIDFMVLDVMMPKLTGLEMYERLVTQGKKIPAVFLTNLTQEEQAKKAISLGAKEYLVKSNLTPSDIVTTVKKYLNPGN